jgi:hypothetical protein
VMNTTAGAAGAAMQVASEVAGALHEEWCTLSLALNTTHNISPRFPTPLHADHTDHIAFHTYRTFPNVGSPHAYTFTQTMLTTLTTLNVFTTLTIFATLTMFYHTCYPRHVYLTDQAYDAHHVYHTDYTHVFTTLTFRPLTPYHTLSLQYHLSTT